MREPLTTNQQRLRGRHVADMSLDQLKDWIEACAKMEVWIKPAKARRSWKTAHEAAIQELERRKN